MYDDYDYGYTYSDAANSAYDASTDWTSAANDSWYAGDTNGYAFSDGQADSWASYGNNMDYLSSDPTDGSAWSGAWNDAATASNDAWNASVDAYVAGDYQLSDQLNQYSIAADSTADATWDAWGSATSGSDYNGFDYTPYAGTTDSSYDTSSSYSSYDTSSSYSSYDTSSYDSGY